MVKRRVRLLTLESRAYMSCTERQEEHILFMRSRLVAKMRLVTLLRNNRHRVLTECHKDHRLNSEAPPTDFANPQFGDPQR
jgi:hypothetical protein